MKDAKPAKLIKALKAMGFVEAGGTKHLQMRDSKGNLAVLPMHGVIKRNTVERIRKAANIDKKTFYSHNFS